MRVGISGWRYPTWRGDFYPPGLVQRRELHHLSTRLDTAEINGTFYSLQRLTSFERWAAQTTDNFRFSVKGSRYVTHMKRLVGVEQALANFFASGVLALGPKLGPILWQFPPQLAWDPAKLGGFLALLPRSTDAMAEMARRHDQKLPPERVWAESWADVPVRHVVEFRHPTFLQPAALAQFDEAGVAVVQADSAGVFPFVQHVTGDLVYVRLHGEVEMYCGSYRPATLRRWAADIRRWASEGRDVWVYFDNTKDGDAPHDARRLRDLVAGRRHRPAPRPDRRTPEDDRPRPWPGAAGRRRPQLR